MKRLLSLRKPSPITVNTNVDEIPQPISTKYGDTEINIEQFNNCDSIDKIVHQRKTMNL